MNRPKWYNDRTKEVFKLMRSLYSLKNTPRCCNKNFNNKVITFDLHGTREIIIS